MRVAHNSFQLRIQCVGTDATVLKCNLRKQRTLNLSIGNEGYLLLTENTFIKHLPKYRQISILSSRTFVYHNKSVPHSLFEGLHHSAHCSHSIFPPFPKDDMDSQHINKVWFKRKAPVANFRRECSMLNEKWLKKSISDIVWWTHSRDIWLPQHIISENVNWTHK